MNADCDVAIVGIGCQFPGGIDSAESLWEFVEAGRHVSSDFPPDRPMPEMIGIVAQEAAASFAPKGGFIDDPGMFDAEFFGISPREAKAMDPQQRVALELCWKSLENATIDPHKLRDSRTGVYIGAMTGDYAYLAVGRHDLDPGYIATGSSQSVLSGRISYLFGFEGPSMTIDTACSSSLVSLHIAAQALRGGECSLALAGGVTIMSTLASFFALGQHGAVSRDGRSKAYSADADGFCVSEGGAVLVLERLTDALRQGHRVLGVLRGSAVNQDGASNGLTAPSTAAQVKLIKDALANAALTGIDIDVVEGHGTGTPVGDPVELEALFATYGQDRPEDSPLLLGSLKSNLGHSQAAAGVAGVIKMIEAMRRGVLPASLHVSEPTTSVDWSEGAVEVVTVMREWPDRDRPRRAGVSSFGISGTNAHVILEQAPDVAAATPGGSGADPADLIWTVSGRTASARSRQAANLLAHLEAHPELDDRTVAHSLATSRAAFEYRAAVVGSDSAAMRSGLAKIADDNSLGVIQGVAMNHRIVFVFPGQGSQYVGMGARLMAESPIFAEHVRACDAALTEYVDWSVAETIMGGPDAADINRSDVVQPLLFAIMTGLAAVWKSVGVIPAAVVGHSQGEVAAAYVAGALSLADASKIIALRSLVVNKLAGSGAMASVGASAGEVVDLLDGLGDITVAAVNSSRATVVSGSPSAVAGLAQRCEAVGTRFQIIDVDYASHSSHFDTLRADIEAAASAITPLATDVKIFSTVTGEVVSPLDLGTDYWFRNVREPVRFSEAVESAYLDGHTAFIEMRLHPVLIAALHDTFEDLGIDLDLVFALGSGTRDDDGMHGFLTAVAGAHVRGVTPDWKAMFPLETPAAQLPGYPFERQNYWLGSSGGIRGGQPSAFGLGDPEHPLLGAITEVPGTDRRLFSTRIALSDHPWLADHAVNGNVLVPGAMLLEMALHAGHRMGSPRVDKLTMHTTISIPTTGGVQLKLLVGDPVKRGQRSISIYARPESDKSATATSLYTLHAEGVLLPASDASYDLPRLDLWPPAGIGRGLDTAESYLALAALGYQYGPAFQGMQSVWRRGDEVFAEVSLPDSVSDADKYGLHPALLDAAMQTMVAAAELTGLAGGIALPYRWENVSLFAVGARSLRVRMTPAGTGRMQWLLCDSSGRTVGTGVLVVRAVASAQLAEQRSRGAEESLFRMDWMRVACTPVRYSADSGEWAVVGPAFGAGGYFRPVADRHGVTDYGDIEQLSASVDEAPTAPAVVVWSIDAGGGASVGDRVKTTLCQLQAWFDNLSLSNTKLVVLSRRIHAPATNGDAVDPVSAAVWGLVRSAQSENPDRIVQIDVDDIASFDTIAAALETDEPELLVRDGEYYGRRILADTTDAVHIGQRLRSPWSLQISATGNLEDTTIVEDTAAEGVAEPAELAPGTVLVELRAAGITFPMVLAGLDRLGSAFSRSPYEASGVVRATASDVTEFAVGDHVFGLCAGIRSRVVVDHRLLARKPVAWSFAEAAAAPVAYLTAAHALRLAAPKSGETVLVHSAAGGVGIAAVHLARRAGLKVLATASPKKWHALQDMGIDVDHIGTSRSVEFGRDFARRGHAVDVVLNSLSAELTQTSLDLLGAGGRFIEIGRAEVLDPDAVTRDRPGITYASFELSQLDPADVREVFAELSAAFDVGELPALPVTGYDIRQAGSALRWCSESHRVGKVVLTWPSAFDPEKTVLLTGGTGAIGKLVARHLVDTYGARRLVLTSRSGSGAADLSDFVEEMTGAGVEVSVEACDVTDKAAMRRVLETLPAEHPLGAVIHLAAVLSDATLQNLTAEDVDMALAAKASGAQNLHELTAGHDLSMFVLFSSAAGSFGAPGQANYAAANCYVDALARHRYRRGLPATSMAWGWWAETSSNTGTLDEKDRARLTRIGIVPMSSATTMRLFDSALTTGLPFLVPIGMNLGFLRAAAAMTELPPVFRSLLQLRPRVTQHLNSPGNLAKRLIGLEPAQQHATIVELLFPAVAMVLGYASTSEITPDREFHEMGIDSLSSIELGTHLRAVTGLKLSNSVIFEYPTVNLLARHVHTQLAFDDVEVADPIVAELELLLSRLAAIHTESPMRPEVLRRLNASFNELSITPLDEEAEPANV